MAGHSSAKNRAEQMAQCPAGEGLDGSAAVNAEMLPSELHLTHATGTGRSPKADISEVGPVGAFSPRVPPLPMNADNEHQLSGIDCKALVTRRPETRHAVTFSTIFPKPPPASMGGDGVARAILNTVMRGSRPWAFRDPMVAVRTCEMVSGTLRIAWVYRKSAALRAVSDGELIGDERHQLM